MGNSLCSSLIAFSNTNMVNFGHIRSTVEKYPKYSEFLQYGTAGFRSRSEKLNHVLFRMGILAVLRSKLKKSVIGIMITASHNPEKDNGVKLIDPLGEMIEQKWEEIATKLVNSDTDEMINYMSEIVDREQIDFSINGTIVVGRDTRSSGEILRDAAKDGISCLGGNVQDFDIVTTPMLHYIVRCMNTKNNYGIPTIEGYFTKLTNAFATLRGKELPVGNYIPEIYLDCANGVGAPKMKEALQYLNNKQHLLTINIYNDDIYNYEKLNNQCGADFVKGNQSNPEGMPIKPNVRCVTFDGDADRILYFYNDQNCKFHLLDGDRIASLFALYLKKLLSDISFGITIGLIQTAYANGNSTKYITETLVKVFQLICNSTGLCTMYNIAILLVLAFFKR